MSKREKKPIIEFEGDKYLRLPIKTHVLTSEDNIVEVVEKYTEGQAEKEDILFISEKATAITQNRAVRLKDIKPRFLARLLSKFVKKVSYGIGLGMPETMEMAFREVGTWRILLATFVSAITKLVGLSGYFYRVAGRSVAMIDGPTPYTLPPYNEYVVLGPENPDKVANQIYKKTGIKTAIVDVNDIGSEVIGVSSNELDKEQIAKILRDNPLGQSSEQTPMGLIRKVTDVEMVEIEKMQKELAVSTE